MLGRSLPFCLTDDNVSQRFLASIEDDQTVRHFLRTTLVFIKYDVEVFCTLNSFNFSCDFIFVWMRTMIVTSLSHCDVTTKHTTFSIFFYFFYLNIWTWNKQNTSQEFVVSVSLTQINIKSHTTLILIHTVIKYKVNDTKIIVTNHFKKKTSTELHCNLLYIKICIRNHKFKII